VIVQIVHNGRMHLTASVTSQYLSPLPICHTPSQ